MRKLVFLLILTSLQFCYCFAQTKSTVVRGRVLEYSTGKPLENVNVFASGTTWGTTTNESGYFEIKNLPPGDHEIVASMIGYESQTKVVLLKSGAIVELEFKLPEAHYELEAVTVSGEAPTEWKNNYKIFEKRFLGTSQFANDCTIKNPEVINFTWTNNHHLTAKAEETLKIINKDLGYEINCVLVKFDWDAEEYHIQAAVRPSFTELKDSTGTLKKKWLYNRKIAYAGSIDNFLRAVKNNSLQTDGFQVYQDFGPLSDIPLRRLNRITDPLIKKNYNQYSLSFSGYLRVLYVLKDPGNPEVSWIKLTYPVVTLDSYGYPIEPLPFLIYGYWTQLGMADMLPKYYSPNDTL
jgi:CarboxypepD_reg-like domain